jgi:hypothetical protein
MRAKFILILCLVLFGGLAALFLLARHDTSQRVEGKFHTYEPVTVSFSRLRGDAHHFVSVYWRIKFAGKKPPLHDAFACWSLRPFRHVTVVTK